MSEIDAGFSSCMILDLEDVLHNFEMVMPVPPVVRETHPSARAVVLESGIETYRDVFLSSRTCLGLVGIWTRTCLGLGHRTRQMFKLVSTESSNICFFFSFKTKPLIWLACSANG